MAKFAIKDIRPNPFRHIERYPIRRDKVEALRESLRKTGFWENMVARLRNGYPEIAYGHHRLVALREEFGPDKEVELIIKDLSDETMLQIMARENMEEWGTNASVEHETIRAVVEAYAEGKIELPKVKPDTKKEYIRYAPSFVPGDVLGPVGARPYTAQTLAEFLGWVKSNGQAQDKVYAALTALQFIEEGILKESDFEGLTTAQAQAVVEQARRAKVEREAIAKLAAQRAEQARKEAKEAERRRREAEAEAAKARDEVARQEAEERARLAEQELRAAQRRAEAEKKKEYEEREKARKQAAEVGKLVSEEIKAGRIGYRQAAEVVAKVIEKREKPIPDIDQFTERLTKSLHEILDPEKDEKRVGQLNELVKFKDNIRPDIRIDLIKVLYLVSERAISFAQRFGGEEYIEEYQQGSIRRLQLTEGGR